MSSHPNTYLVASIKYPHGVEDEYIEFDGEIYEDRDLIYLCEDNDQGINIAEGCFGLYTHITYGWGDSISVSELAARILKFQNDVDRVVNGHQLELVGIEIGADWF